MSYNGIAGPPIQSPNLAFLRAPAGAGKSVLLRMAAEALGKTLYHAQQPQMKDLSDGWLIWDVPTTSRSARLSAKVMETADHVITACRPNQRISGLARRIPHHGSVTFDAERLAFSADELEVLPPEQRDCLLQHYAGWPAFLPLAARPVTRSASIICGRRFFLSYRQRTRQNFRSRLRHLKTGPRESGIACSRRFLLARKRGRRIYCAC